MGQIIENILVLARERPLVDKVQVVTLTDLVDRSWSNVPTGDVTVKRLVWGAVDAERDRMIHLLENLSPNSVKHANKPSAVRFRQLDRDDFYADDNRPKILDARRERVFDPDYSTASDRIESELTPVRRIAEAHGCDMILIEGRAGGAGFESTALRCGHSRPRIRRYSNEHATLRNGHGYDVNAFRTRSGLGGSFVAGAGRSRQP